MTLEDFQQKVRDGGYETKLPYGPTPEAKIAHREDANRLNDEFFKELEAYALQSGVPARYASKVVRKAWGDGHSCGYSEVLNCLDNLIEIFT